MFVTVVYFLFLITFAVAAILVLVSFFNFLAGNNRKAKTIIKLALLFFFVALVSVGIMRLELERELERNSRNFPIFHV